MTEKTKLDVNSWKFKTIERNRGRMKLQIKLNKEEAQAFKNFMTMVKPSEVSDDDFMKGIFKIGIETMEQKLLEAVKQHAQENDIDLSAVPALTEDSESAVEEISVPVVGAHSMLKPSTESSDEVQTDQTN